mmetsp:Transcript_19663/g.24246  ORF Transcript_19663/g.24246 Transcript_19663/m.24246 type:complete len:248 (-) Transcript_19663:127-870(-)
MTMVRSKSLLQGAIINLALYVLLIQRGTSFAPQFSRTFSSTKTLVGKMTLSNDTVSSVGQDTKEALQQKLPIEKKMPTNLDGPVKRIHSIDDFLHEIETAPTNGLVVVQYHAKWCKICARVTVKMRQMAERLQQKGTPVPVSFISVEYTANKEICSTLDIKKFPFIQMYRNRECVVSFGTGPVHNFQPAVGGTLNEKLALTEDQWEDFRQQFNNEIAEGLKLLEVLRLSKIIMAEERHDVEDTNVAP